MYGYTGNILVVDLSLEKIEKVPLEEGLARKYLGGLGINTKLLFDHTPPHIDPLGEENSKYYHYVQHTNLRRNQDAVER